MRNGDDKRTASVVVDATKGKNAITATCQGGLKDLLVLKTHEVRATDSTALEELRQTLTTALPQSSFENFWVDEYTTLKPVSDRIFSTSVDCVWQIPILPKHLTGADIGKLGIDFDAIYQSVEGTTLDIFATHNSASVQATLYNMCEKVLNDNSQVSDIKYELPNKVGLPPSSSSSLLPADPPPSCPRTTPADLPSVPTALHRAGPVLLQGPQEHRAAGRRGLYAGRRAERVHHRARVARRAQGQALSVAAWVEVECLEGDGGGGTRGS